MGYSGALGKLIHEKPEVKNFVALSLKILFRPFILLIMSTESKLPLFIGHVTNPVDSKASDTPGIV